MASQKLFVNLPVRDLQRAIGFFTKLGFQFNPQFTDDTAACMIVNEDAYFMLLTEKRFADFARRPIADAQKQTGALYAVSAASRAAVDQFADTALKLGGKTAYAAQDHGFMYARSFYDLDGHHWEVMWMDMEAFAKMQEQQAATGAQSKPKPPPSANA